MQFLLNDTESYKLENKLSSLINKSGFGNEIRVIKIESIGKNGNIIRKFNLEGNVSISKRNELSVLKDLIYSNSDEDKFNFDFNEDFPEFSDKYDLIGWKINVSYLFGDKMPKFNYFDFDENLKDYNFDEVLDDVNKHKKVDLNIFHFWTMYNKSFDSELQFIEIKNIIENDSIKGKTQIEEVNVDDYFTNFVMINCDNDYDKYKEFVTHKSWNIFVRQIMNPNMFENLHVNDTPYMIITDNKGIIFFAGVPYSIKLVESIKNLKISKKENSILPNLNSSSNNLWWIDLDYYGQQEIINEVNSGLDDLGLIDISFTVVTHKTIFKNEDYYSIIPIISGTVELDQYINLQNYINDLEDTLDFKAINVDVIKLENKIQCVNSFDIKSDSLNTVNSHCSNLKMESIEIGTCTDDLNEFN